MFLLTFPHQSAEFIKEARDLFTAVGSSDSERDTIPGRKCMAQYYFFEKRWDDVLIYLNSIAEYCHTDPAFNYDLGIALAGNGEWEEAAKRLALVQEGDPEASSFTFQAWLARAHINRGAPEEAWKLYLKLVRVALYRYITTKNDVFIFKILKLVSIML